MAACLTGWVLEGSQDVNGMCVCVHLCVYLGVGVHASLSPGGCSKGLPM